VKKLPPRTEPLDINTVVLEVLEMTRNELQRCGISLRTQLSAENPLVLTKPDGMGMGLSISRSIVVAHGGRLWAMANEPRGAVFQFALPAAESDTRPKA
jgi:C4-dicarboxylate-specific signal transduction histidine kinase